MKEVIFNVADYKTPYETYKDFYEDVFIKLDGKGIIDFENMPTLYYSADCLNEFMWYNHNENLKLVFVGLDLDKIKKRQAYDDTRWELIISVMEDFVKKFPNNTLEFRDK